MKLLVITNRNIVTNDKRTESFGERVNEQGPCELRLAWVKKEEFGWEVEVIEEGIGSPDHAPSKEAIAGYLQELKDNDKDCVFYIHGFFKTFEESIDQAHRISVLYDVGVIVFSWPSKPARSWVGDQYQEAKCIASVSVAALDRTFEKFCSVIDQKIEDRQGFSINLLIHSLGNYMFEKYIRDPIFQRETRVFDNIVLNAPDVDHKGHRQWMEKLKYSKRVYVTINEDDDILGLSRAVNPDRLGNTANIPKSKSKRVVCFDVSNGKDVDGKHEHFGATSEVNVAVKRFFDRALHGKRGLPCRGTTFDSWTKAYVLEELEDEDEGDNTE